MAPIPFEGAFNNVDLIAKTRAALEAACDEAWCRQSVSELQLLEAVLCQLKDLSPTTASEETTRIVALCGLAYAPLLDCFLQELEKLQPDLDHYFAASEDTRDVGNLPLWATAVERNTTNLMKSIGMQLQLTNSMLRVESLRDLATRCEIQRTPNIPTELIPLETAAKVPSEQFIVAGNGNLYQGIHIGGSVRAHLGNTYSYLGVPKASVDRIFEKLDDLATSRQADALQSSLKEMQQKQSDEFDVLSVLEARTQQFFEQLGKLADAVANGATSLPFNAETERLHKRMSKRKKTYLLRDLSSILEIFRIWLSTVIMMLLMGSQSVQSFIRSAGTFIQSPSMLLDNNIKIIDALDQELSLPYEHFRSWPTVLARLQYHMKGSPGESYVAREKFGLFRAAKKPQNQVMIPLDQWERSVFPGDRLLMSIDLERFDSDESPSCGCGVLREMQLIPVFSKCDECGQSVLTVRGDLTNKVLPASRAYGPDDQHHSSRNVVEAKDFQRFARVHGRHREQPPEVPLATLGFVTETAPAPPSLSENVLGLTEENLALFEKESLSQSEKKRFADKKRLGAQRGSVFKHSSNLRFMQTNNQEPERKTRRDSRSRPHQEPEPLTGQDDMWSSPPSSNGRSPKYIQQQQQQREPRVYIEERPRMQRRVTEFARILPNSDFGWRGRNDVDFTDRRVYGDVGERRGGRERQPIKLQKIPRLIS